MTVTVPAPLRELPGTARTAARWSAQHAAPRLVMRRMAATGDLQGTMLMEHGTGRLHEIFEQIRDEGRVYRGSLGYVTTSHQVCKEVLAGGDFHVGFARGRLPGVLGKAALWAQAGGPIGPLTPPSLLAVEPPDHTRYRKLVTRVFSVRAVQQLRERAITVADELLDDLAGESEVDLVERYCSRLPMTMIAEILGVPPEERQKVLEFGEGAAPSLDLGLDWATFRDVEASLAAFEEWLGEHIARLRANPSDDLMSQLVAATEDGRGLDDHELRATAGLVLAAGFETTVNLLGNGVALLTRHRDQLDGLLAADPGGDEGGGAKPAVERWTNAVDEVLRFDPPVLLTGRSTATDTELDGRSLPAQTMVTVVLAAANRDPEVFDRPQEFDVTRENAGDHLSFSGGRHYCLGAALARMEGEVGLSRLLARYPDLEVLPGATRRPTRILRGYATLPVRLGEPAT
ncbi:cytochrome P450 [Nocardioidaceae bacterium]|nr:cytochrome P450 [Nocardioidaceae bacterium]